MRKDYVRKRQPRFTAAWWAKFTKADEATGCVLWTGCSCKQGYGRMWFHGRSGFPAHRAAYELAFGPFDPSMVICHRCDVRNCVNPAHLFIGTQKENLQDMFAKGRARPQGRAPGWRENAVASTPLPSSLSRKNFKKSGEVVGIVHHMCTSVMPARWCQVLGQPGASDASEIPEGKRPRWWTVELPEKRLAVSDCGDGGALVSEAAS